MTRSFGAACLAIAVLSVAGCGGASEKDMIDAAQVSIEQKDARTALIQLKNTIQKYPDSGQARLLLGKTLLAGGDPVAAAVELGKAEELQVPEEQVAPELARARLSIGEEAKIIAQYASLRLKDATATADLQTSVAVAYATQSDPNKARQALQVALQAKPMYAPAVVVQARMQAGDGNFDGALALLESILAKEPDNERAGVLKGEVLTTGKKDTAAALLAYRKVLAANPKSLAANAAVVKLLSAQGKDGEARAQIEELKKIAPAHPETLFFQAEAALADKDFKRTREITDRMLKLMPDNARVLELAGAAEFSMRQFAQAEAFFAKALKGVPGLLRARHMLAQTHLDSNQPNKVIEVLRPVLESKQVDGTSLSMAGQAWLQLGEGKKAEAAFQAAAKLAPDDPQVRTTAALSQLARGNLGAIADLEKSAAQDRGVRADMALISARLAQKDLAGALKAIDNVERKLPDQPLAHNLRGRVLLLKGDIPAATRSFEAALAKDANFYPSIASLAAIDLGNGKADAARKRFEDLITAQPKNYLPLLALAELSARTGGTQADVLKLMRDAVKASPGDSAPNLALINQLLGLGEGKQALAAAQVAAAALPLDLDVMQALGRAQIAAGDGSQAVATAKKLAALQPTNPMHQMLLADALLASRDNLGAAQALRQALEITPDLLQALAGQVTLALLDRRPQDGLSLARAIQRKEPRLALGYSLEGDVEASRNGWDAAAAGYRQALQRAAAPEVAIKLHGALRRAGKSADADRVAGDWLRANPKDSAFHFYLGDLLRAGNDAAGAESHYRKVLEQQPNNPMALNNVAWLLAKQGKPGAVAMAEKANAMLPDNSALMDTLAAALAAENQLPQAIEVQARAVARNPGDPGLKLSLARLYAKEGDKARARSELEGLARLGDKFPDQAEVTKLLRSL